jgi:hypothetical protein
MRLINTNTLEFAEFLGPTTPPYAILSHTWEDGEVSLREMTDPSPSVTSKNGYRKIVDYCRLAAREGYGWAWIDTCCIDKTNHAELAESINSMFRWYEEAIVCHVFLADLAADAELEDALSRCRWFTRGWTLQELIAPKTVHFHDQSWDMRGTKANLITELAAITGILDTVLDGGLPLHQVCIAVRMSWASNRETTRPEDAAYCLLGIFDVNMPMIYGEGKKAFRRLQEEIIRQSTDLTVFACHHQPEAVVHAVHVGSEFENGTRLDAAPMLASSPRDFKMHSTRQAQGLLRTIGISKWSDLDTEYAITNKGLRMTTRLALLADKEGRGSWVTGVARRYFLALGEVQYDTNDGGKQTKEIIGIILNKVGPNIFLRRGGTLDVIPRTRMMSTILTPPLGFYIWMGDYKTFHVMRESLTRQIVILPRCGVVTVKFSSANVADGGPRPTPSNAMVRVVRAIPASHWDETNRYFLYPLKDPLVLAVNFKVELDGQTTHLICTIDKRGSYPPPAYLSNPSEEPGVNRWFYSREAAREGSSWEDVPLKLSDPTKPLTSETTVRGVSYSVTIEKLGADDPRSSAAKTVFELRLRITQHSTAASNSITEQLHGQPGQDRSWIKLITGRSQTRR